MEIYELRQMQALPLHLKIIKTQMRIQEWYDAHDGMIYVAFSGGLDSTVLMNITRKLYPSVSMVFSNTGLEYPEIVKFVKQHSPIEIIRPKRTYAEVIEKYGYPVISKEVSQKLYEIRTGKSEILKNRHLNGDSKGNGKLPKKYRFLIDAPFKISSKCCNWLKKQPLDAYEKTTSKASMTGMRADESRRRTTTYLLHGCNSYTGHHKSMPLAFWTHQDILSYIVAFNIPYCNIYGDIIYNPTTDKLETTGEQRTGCYACMFGVHMEKNGNKFTRMKLTHPNQYNYCINHLGQGTVLDYIGVEYGQQQKLTGL